VVVDAYCGDGLFALTLVPHFGQVAGIGFSADSIRFATDNAALNSLAHEVSFRAGDAALIFSAIGVRRQGIRVTATRLSHTGDRVRSHNMHAQAWEVC